MAQPHLARLSLTALALLVGAWASALSIAYLAGRGGIARHQVESAVTAFVVLGILARLGRPADEAADRSVARAWHRHPAMWCAVGLLLYWPSLSIGWLSDDFVLIARARLGDIGAVHAELFRPAVLAGWQLLLAAGLGAVTLHALTIATHGVVAFLTVRLALRLGLSHAFATGAGGIVLTFPASVEAVTWTSGTFDVAATAGVLAAALVALGYGDRPSAARRLALAGCSVAALLCKETAAVAPVLIALLAWSLGRRSRTLWLDLAAIGVIFGAVGATRLSLASELIRQPVTRYTLQRWLFGTVGGAAVPWHIDVMAAMPVLAVGGASLLLVIALVFVARPAPPTRVRLAAAAAVWVLVGSAPTLPFFFVGPDLQGSRYLYLPIVGWALLMAAMARSLDRAGLAALVALSLSGAVGVVMHQQPWRDAAAARDAVLASARAGRERGCAAVAVSEVPDAVRGAYVFRNGVKEAFESLGVELTDNAGPGCTVEGRPVPAPRPAR